MEKKSEKMNFEEAMTRLEAIVKSLEKGDLSLDKAMSSFEEGVKLSRVCLDQLEKADRKVEILLQGKDGQKKTEPFEVSETS